jgi:hypothetical protein
MTSLPSAPSHFMGGKPEKILVGSTVQNDAQEFGGRRDAALRFRSVLPLFEPARKTITIRSLPKQG